jgi:cytoskeletal protein CcmA (bactofilin family)
MLTRSRLPAILLAALATLALASPVAAGEFRSERSVTVAEGETIDDDLYAAAGTVNIDGTINGDATVAAGTVRVAGSVSGSLNVGGGTVEVLGDVGGAVRVSGGTVRILGTVGRDVVVFGGTATIESSAEVAGDVAGGVGSLVIDGTVGGDVVAGAGSLEVSGTVNGSIDAGVGSLTIESGAVVNGDVRYTSSRDATIADDAQIGGEVTRDDPPVPTDTAIVPDNPIVTYLGLLLGMLLLGWAMLALRPRLTLGSAETLRTAPLLTVGVGLAALIGQFVLIAILVLLGILLAIVANALGGAFVALTFVALLLILLALILAVVPIAMAIGQLVLPGDRSPYLEYLAGAAILALVFVAGGYVPALGALVFFLAWCLGLGAFVVYLFRTRERPYVLAEAPAVVVEAPPA